MKNYVCPNRFIKGRLIFYELFILIIFLLNIFSFSVCYSQIAPSNDRFSYSDIPLEKIYLHTDKTIYNAGDVIWFKAYLVDAATLMPEAPSEVVYADFINPSGELLITKTIKIVDGCGNGDFKLHVSLTGGEYTLRAYTTYMRNFDNTFFFRKNITINPVIQNLTASQDSTQTALPVLNNDTVQPTKPDVQFFPEGGYLVCGFPCNIGIKAVGPNGKGIDISGVIFDSLGKKFSEFSTLKFGLGAVQLVPLPGEIYKASISWNNTKYEYELPTALTDGAAMQITGEEDYYRVTVRSSLPNRIKNFTFIGTQRDNTLFDTNIKSDDEGIILIVPKNMFEEGIAQFTLFDENDNPVCERLVFVETTDAISSPNISPSKKQYEKKELVELNISTDASVLPEPDANMSVAVAPVSEMSDKSETDIKSFLLLNSELRGNIEHPGYYFYSDDPIREKVLDLLLMTQGWRRYIWEETLMRDTITLLYQPETGLRFEGTITKFGNHKKSTQAVVSLSCNNNHEFSQYETDADENGHFKFDGIVFEDSTSVIIQAKKNTEEEKKSGMNYYIEMAELAPPREPEEFLHSKHLYNETPDSSHFQSVLTRQEIDSLYIAEKGNIMLEEVVVTEKKPDRIAEKRTLYFDPSYFINVSEIYKKFKYPDLNYLMNGRVPGIEVRTRMEDHSRLIYMKNHGPGYSIPLFYLDGAPSTLDEILMLPLSEIHFVDVLKPGPKTVIYSPGSPKGVIAVYTLDAEDKLNFEEPVERKGIINFTHPGFSKVREFYTPVYTSEKSKQKPDYRTTLYWNPTLKTDEENKTKISFYTSDVPSVYKVVLEGISSEGDIIHSETSFSVK